MAEMFGDRIAAGRQLAVELGEYRRSETTIVGLARGGVAVGYGLAQALELPLEALVIRKVGAPNNPELAIGAVSETGTRWIDREMVLLTGASDRYVQSEVDRQIREAARQRDLYGRRAPDAFSGARRAILVDDGIATGASALVGLLSLRELGASPILLATPVAAQAALALLASHAERVVALRTPDPFVAVGAYYETFGQVSDSEVLTLLRASAESRRGELG